MVSILGHHNPYEFPEPVELELRLKDVLEDKVDEKFYLGDEQTKRLTGNTFHQANARLQEKDYSDTLLALDYKDPKCVRVGGIFDKDGTKHQAGAVWDKNQISPTLDTMQGGWRQPSVVVEPKPKLVGGIGERNFGKQYRQGNRVYDSEAIAMCLQAGPVGNAGGNSYLYKTNLRIRKLTPKECWRLMGFSDDDFHKAEGVNSATQLYKQAGNSIVVNVLEGIFKQLLEEEK